MLPPPPRSTLFPYTTLFRSLDLAKELIVLIQMLDRFETQYYVDRRAIDRHLLGTPNPEGNVALTVIAVRMLNRSEEHTSELQSHHDLVCRLLLEKKNKKTL